MLLVLGLILVAFECPDARGAQYQEFEITPHLIKDPKAENTMALFFKGPTRGYQHCELLFLGPELKADLQVCPGLYAPDETESLKDKAWAKGKKGRYGFWRATFKTPVLKDVAAAVLTGIGGGGVLGAVKGGGGTTTTNHYYTITGYNAGQAGDLTTTIRQTQLLQQAIG
jgi:hypothetical protein